MMTSVKIEMMKVEHNAIIKKLNDRIKCYTEALSKINDIIENIDNVYLNNNHNNIFYNHSDIMDNNTGWLYRIYQESSKIKYSGHYE